MRTKRICPICQKEVWHKTEKWCELAVAANKQCNKCSILQMRERWRTGKSNKANNYAGNKKETKEKRKKKVKDTSTIKSNYGCSVCGEKEPVCLDFHHIDPLTKTFNISRLRHTKLDILINEINKCIILCANCHRKVHANLLDIKMIDPLCLDKGYFIIP